MHVAESSMLDQGVVEQRPRASEVELVESAMPRFLDRKRGANHAPGVIVESSALEKQAPRLCVLTSQPGNSTAHEQRPPLGEMSARVPEFPQSAGEPGIVGGRGVTGPIEGGVEVVVLGFEPVEPFESQRSAECIG